MLAWQTITGEIVYPHEFEWLRAMDREYCAKMNDELQSFQARRAVEDEARLAAARTGR